MISLNNRKHVFLDTCCNLHWDGIHHRLRTKRLKKLSKKGLQGKVRTFIENNLEQIIKAEPAELYLLHERLNNLISAAGVTLAYQGKLKKIVSKIFDYGWLKNEPESDSYWIFTLAKNLSVDVCPYCNANFTLTITDSAGKKVARPAFDHFFNKSDYPLLSISFYNLIPSCNVCNSDIKGDTAFTLDENFHPYIHDIEADIKFGTRIKSAPAAFGFNDDFDLTISSKAASAQSARIDNHIKAFRLADIYRYRKSYAAEIMKKNYALSGSYASSLSKAFPSLKFNREDLYRFAYGNFLEDENLSLRPLSKMTRDLVRALDDYFA